MWAASLTHLVFILLLGWFSSRAIFHFYNRHILEGSLQEPKPNDKLCCVGREGGRSRTGIASRRATPSGWRHTERRIWNNVLARKDETNLADDFITVSLSINSRGERARESEREICWSGVYLALTCCWAGVIGSPELGWLTSMFLNLGLWPKGTGPLPVRAPRLWKTLHHQHLLSPFLKPSFIGRRFVNSEI